MRGVFVTGTDTGAGKTVLSALLMAGAPPHARYWKPVQTGPDDDTAAVRRLAALPASRLLDRGVRLALPASPHHAAAAEGTRLALDPLVGLARAEPAGASWVVEGAGGLLVPLSDRHLLPDLVRALGLPLVVAVPARLGAINHTLLTLRQAAAEGLPVLGVVVLGPEDPSLASALAAHADRPILGRVPWLDPLDPPAVAAWGARLLADGPLREALA